MNTPAYRKRYRRTHKIQISSYHKEWARLLKVELLRHYGSECACCGERIIEFLSLDHVGGGHGTKRLVKGPPGGGVRLYSKLRKQGWPKKGYRILCYNCNLSLGFLGYCPHILHKPIV